MENNVITLVGTVETFPVYSHTVLEENFYGFLLRVPRLSNNDDMLPDWLEGLVSIYEQTSISVRKSN